MRRQNFDHHSISQTCPLYLFWSEVGKMRRGELCLWYSISYTIDNIFIFGYFFVRCIGFTRIMMLYIVMIALSVIMIDARGWENCYCFSLSLRNYSLSTHITLHFVYRQWRWWSAIQWYSMWWDMLHSFSGRCCGGNYWMLFLSLLQKETEIRTRIREWSNNNW